MGEDATEGSSVGAQADAESKQLIGGFAVLELSGMDEAIELSKRYAAILGGTLEMDIRPLAEPEAA